MLRKRTRSIQKEQHQMGDHQPISESDSGSESGSFFFHSDVLKNNKNPKSNSFYSVTGLLVGLNPKGSTDCDSSVRSPTSPLDFKLFSNLGNPFFRSSTRRSSSQENGQQRSWGGGSRKVGLISIIDSLDDDMMKFPGKVLRSSESSKNILFGPRFRVKTCSSSGQANTNSFESPKSLPKNYYAISPHYSSKTKPTLEEKGSSDVLFEIGESPLEEPEHSFGQIRSCSLDSCRKIPNHNVSGGNLNKNFNNPNSTSINFCLENNVTTTQFSSPQFFGGSPNSNQVSGPKLMSTIPGSLGSGNGFIGSVSGSEIELSEDYTCVISHGPNPKTTHIYGDCILETQPCDLSNFAGKSGENEEIKLSQPVVKNAEISASYPSDYFLSFCYSCNKKLEDGKDIYIYRGEQAFCSLSCRSLEILMDEELEKSNDEDSENPLNSHDVDDDDDGKELFETGLIAAI